ncbi:MAG: ORF6N domain-containing protein [Flavobacteriales bacterium]|nr:ORF6N domain-containing protein [Flavobacteriales bacterium]
MSAGRKNIPVVSEELVISRIYTIRGYKVMLDRDLAELYGVPTKALKQAVRRNAERFPEDFMFELSAEELEHWRSQIVTSNPGDRMGLRYAPFAFTEHGVLMLSSVLNSAAAIAVNIQVIRVFTRMRELLANHKDVLLALEKLRGTVSHNSRDIKVIFRLLKKMEEDKSNRALLAQSRRSGRRSGSIAENGSDDARSDAWITWHMYKRERAVFNKEDIPTPH